MTPVNQTLMPTQLGKKLTVDIFIVADRGYDCTGGGDAYATIEGAKASFGDSPDFTWSAPTEADLSSGIVAVADVGGGAEITITRVTLGP